MPKSTTVEYIESVETDDGKFDVWSETGSLDVETIYVSEFAEDDVKKIEDDELESFVRSELESDRKN